jgi:hypothetical protein
MKRAFTLLAIAAVMLAAAGAAEASRHEYDYGRGHDRYSRSGHESRTKLYGTVDRMPSRSLNGIWIVDGRHVAVTPSTRIKEKYGRLTRGAYVEIEGYYDRRGFTAYEIEVKGGRGGYRYR